MKSSSKAAKKRMTYQRLRDNPNYLAIERELMGTRRASRKELTASDLDGLSLPQVCEAYRALGTKALEPALEQLALETFHGDDYSIFHGSSQNAYLIEEEKTILVDTVWTPHHYDFIQNLKSEIDLKKIDAIIVNHGEADHSGALPALLGTFVPALSFLANIGWVLGFVLALVLYPLLMKSERGSLLTEEEDEIITEYGESVVLPAKESEGAGAVAGEAMHVRSE